MLLCFYCTLLANSKYVNLPQYFLNQMTLNIIQKYFNSFAQFTGLLTEHFDFHLPTPFSKAINASAHTNSTFVTEAVNDLLKLNLVEEMFCAPDIINPLSVSTRSSGKQRLILDLRHVNSFLYKQKFKCEDLSMATQIFSVCKVIEA